MELLDFNYAEAPTSNAPFANANENVIWVKEKNLGVGRSYEVGYMLPDKDSGSLMPRAVKRIGSFGASSVLITGLLGHEIGENVADQPATRPIPLPAKKED